MSKVISFKIWLCALVVSFFITNSICFAVSKVEQRPIDLVIALDTSGSMNGLIDSAKQRLWEIVSELADADPMPDLRVAILTYGNDGHARNQGWVSLDIPFTRDLDAVNETLFSFRTNGGQEYVSRVIDRSLSALEWSSDQDGLRIIMVAGNEPATQDPLISLRVVSKSAVEKGVVVNPIFCGTGNSHEIPGWRQLATLTNGIFSTIDQNQAARPVPQTPLDKELISLNDELNKTYVAYGVEGQAYKANQIKQDSNAVSMSRQALAARALAKSKQLYRNEMWDLVDAYEGGKQVTALPEEELPEEMRKMSQSEREQYVKSLVEKRTDIQEKIRKLEKERRLYIEKITKEQNSEQGLDQALLKAIRTQATKKGFSFPERAC